MRLSSIRSAKKHLSMRLRQRHGIKFSPNFAANRLRSYIYSQGCKLIKECGENRKLYLIEIESKKIPVVYDHDIKCPITVLCYRE